MAKKQIHQLPEQKFTSDAIEYCFYVEDMNKPTMKTVRLKSIFDWIKEEANKEGLAVKFTGDNIMFISSEEYLKDKTILPTSLTAENGSKSLLSGEFKETYVGMDEEGGEFHVDVPVTWSTIKEIYSKIVNHFN